MIDLIRNLDKKSQRAADFVAKGWITRIALVFNAAGDRRFTGNQIAAFLLAAWHHYQNCKDLPDELIAQHLLDMGDGDALERNK